MATNVPKPSASARDAYSTQMRMKEVELECGDISASQEELLARSSFLGGGVGEEPEVLSTPPPPGVQSSQGQGGKEQDAINMCTQPFTQHPPSPSRSSSEDSTVRTRVKEPPKPRICTRKVRRGTRMRTPSPECPAVREEDPLLKAVLMIPSSTPAPTFTGDILALARQRGIF